MTFFCIQKVPISNPLLLDGILKRVIITIDVIYFCKIPSLNIFLLARSLGARAYLIIPFYSPLGRPTCTYQHQLTSIVISFNIAADESLKFWKIFEKKAGTSTISSSSSSSGKADMAKQMTIR